MSDETNIMIAAISAGSAIAGVGFSQVVSIMRDHLDKKHGRNVLLREKYEELAMLVINSQEWITTQFNASSLALMQSSQPVMARRAMVLSHIYFPELQDSCENYVNACLAFQMTLIKNHEFRPDYDAGTQAMHRNPNAVNQSSLQLKNVRQKLDEEIISCASVYAKY